MPYYLYMRAAGGTETRLDRAHNSIEDAMTPACGALRARGITDAWVVDENGMKHADLEAIGPDNGYGVKDARAATIEPNEQGAIGPTQMRSTWRTLPKNVELMPQHQDLGLQLLSRLEAVAQHADE